MKLRLTALLLAVPAVVVSLLVSTPAEGDPSDPYTAVTSRTVAMTEYSSTGLSGGVTITCRSTSTCRGTLQFKDSSASRKRAYSIKGKSTATIPITMSRNTAADPYENGTPTELYEYVPDAKIIVDENSPRNTTATYTVRTETLAKYGRIHYTINGDDTFLKDMKVSLVRVLAGGNTQEPVTHEVSSGASGNFVSGLGANNSVSVPFALRISATDTRNGERYSWYWRGSDGNASAGGRYLREATAVRATKDVWEAEFSFGTIRGTAPSGATVRVLAPPASYTTSDAVRRSLDAPICANVFGQVKASNDAYSIPFLPYDPQGGDKRYMVNAKLGSGQVWRGDDTTPYGSCSDVLNYNFNRANLIVGAANMTNVDVEPRLSNNTVTVRRFYSGFTPTSSDKWVVLREKIHGLTVLEAPIVAQGSASGGDGGRNAVFKNVPPGRYWVEVGRRTGCSSWNASLYPNNAAYFNGADRGAEAWKSFSTLYAVPGTASTGLRRIAISNGAIYSEQGKRPSGYAGWMFRGYCKALGTGTYTNELNISGFDQNAVTVSSATNRKGAIVSGKVTRTGGRTNKEMMVRLSSTDGKRVLRTDLTDSGGKFYIAGLPSGNWEISVNSDSWRGIGRTFSGKHYVRVTAGKTYSVGTLKFSG